MSSSAGMVFPRDAGVDFLRVLPGLEIADTFHALTGYAAVETPELRLGIVNLLAVFAIAVNEFLDPVDFVAVEAGGEVSGNISPGRAHSTRLVYRHTGNL